jgi:mono/diheme cytochrome c family protein
MRLTLASLCLSACCVAACGGPTPDAAKDLPKGDVARGQQAFVDLQCHACHQVAGGGLPAPSVVPAVALGGTRLLPPSEQDIATDIVLPSSHFAAGYPTDQIVRDDKSKMPDYSKQLTKAQLADLAAFLKSRYHRGLPSATK